MAASSDLLGEFGKYHQPLWRRSDKVDRVTRNQRQASFRAVIQDGNICGLNNTFFRYYIVKLLTVAFNVYVIPRIQLIDVAEECVAVCRDDGVPNIAGHHAVAGTGITYLPLMQEGLLLVVHPGVGPPNVCGEQYS